MKYNMKYLLVVCVVGVLLSSCSNWLDVKPQTEQKEESLFKTEQGFMDALIGAYVEMKSPSLYGSNLTYNTLEFLVQHWGYSSQTYAEKLSMYNYEDDAVKTTFTSVYGQFYKVISSCNNIVKYTNLRKDVFTKKHYELVRGEALAVRAWMHFDVLRLFGPSPLAVTNGEKILPYVTELSIEINNHIDYNNYIVKLENDLKEAETLLKVSDPIIDDNRALYDMSSDNFVQSRKLRINYYALKGLMARFYLWTGENSKAFDCAKEVIEAKNNLSATLFPLATLSTFLSEDKALSNEWLFGVSVKNLNDIVSENFTDKTTGAKLTKPQIPIENQLLESNPGDARWNLWENHQNDMSIWSELFKKYYQKDLNMLPMIRISEMYLIAAETAASLDEAKNYFKQFRDSRNIITPIYLGIEQLKTDVIMEYEKEFYGEGQMFYAYKRINSPTMLWSIVPITPAMYRVPLPENEIKYLN